MRTIGFVILMLLASHAFAHKPSDSYLQLTPSSEGFTGEWRIALRDLDVAVGIDRDGDRQITWGELRAQHGAIAAYALPRLRISADRARCQVLTGAQLVDDLSDGAYTVLPLAVKCGRNAAPWTLEYELLFDLDPTHRGLLTLRSSDSTQTFMLSPARKRAELPVAAANHLGQVTDMLREGVWHIWTGYDHILFLLALLLPAGLRGASTRDQEMSWMRLLGRAKVTPYASAVEERRGCVFHPLTRDVLILVTAFTVAHSITLSLASLQIVSMPPRLIETAIAISIIVAGLRLKYPHSRSAAWIAFGFGLVHGFGFANVLADMQLPTDSLALSLFAFNAGVELGQCVIVIALLPIIRYAQRHDFYRRSFIPAAAVIIAAIGVAWSIERGADVDLVQTVIQAARDV